MLNQNLKFKFKVGDVVKLSAGLFPVDNIYIDECVGVIEDLGIYDDQYFVVPYWKGRFRPEFANWVWYDSKTRNPRNVKILGLSRISKKSLNYTTA